MLKAVNMITYTSVARITSALMKAMKVSALPMGSTNNISGLI